MSDTIYNVEDIKNRINEGIDFYTARINAWESVERAHKKNGGDFADLSRNFTGAKFVREYSETYLYVYFRTKSEGYTYDFITLGDSPYSKRPALDTADAIEKAITELITKYKERLACDIRQAEIAEEVATPFINAVNSALATVKEKAGDDTTLYYACRDYMKSIYW